MRVLIVEDEAKMAGLIRKGRRQEGMAADLAGKGEDALWMAGSTEYDAIVLDLMLPDIDGFEVCRRLRDDGVISPILMLTARDGVPDRVAGLDAGADDYLVKPCSCAARSTSRSVWTPFRPCAARGTGCARTAARESTPDPIADHPRVRRRDGCSARGPRSVHLPAIPGAAQRGDQQWLDLPGKGR